MADYNVYCAGGCGKLQAYADSAKNAAKHKLFCPACAAAQPKPILVNKNKALEDVVAEIKAAGTVTPQDIEKVVSLLMKK